MRGKFIVFEGMDGSGTSTQASLLRKYFLKMKKVAYLTSEPSDGPVGNMIRQAFKKRVKFFHNESTSTTQSKLFDHQMAYLFAADRHDHLYNDYDGVMKHLDQPAHVISTRYFFSSLAYHCEDEDDLALVRSLNSRFPDPDLVIYLRNSVTVSMSRMNERAFRDEYENERKLMMVSNNYEKIFSSYNGELLVVDATEDVDIIHARIVDRLNSLGGY